MNLKYNDTSMLIYVNHSTSFDYQTELYQPIRNSSLNSGHTIVLPHEDSVEPYDSKKVIQDAAIVLAEVSYPSTGQGIELGWASTLGKRIVCVFRKGAKYSSSLKVVSDEFIEYESLEDMLQKLSDSL